jgi:hypothetical protein
MGLQRHRSCSQRAGAGINHHVKVGCVFMQCARAQRNAQLLRQCCMPLAQLVGALRGAIHHLHGLWPLLKQGAQHPRAGTTSAHQQHP